MYCNNKLTFKQQQIAALFAGCMLIMLVSLALLCASCGNGSKVTTPADETVGQTAIAPEEGARPFEWEDESGTVQEGVVYSTNHTFGNEAVEQTLTNMHAASFVLMLEDQGFSVTLNRCQFFETYVEHGTRTYKLFMTLVIFEQQVATGQSFACLRYTRIQGIAESMQLEKDYIGADPWICWEQSEDAHEQPIGILAEGMWWAQSFKPWKRSFIERPSMSPTYVLAWDWLDWALCTVEGTVVGCTVAAAACGIWGDEGCTGDHCEESAVSSAIQCATQQLFGD